MFEYDSKKVAKKFMTQGSLKLALYQTLGCYKKFVLCKISYLVKWFSPWDTNFNLTWVRNKKIGCVVE